MCTRQVVELLVEAGGIPVDLPTREGRALDTDLGQTPLVLAARGGHLAAVTRLMELKANVEARYRGRTGKHYWFVVRKCPRFLRLIGSS